MTIGEAMKAARKKAGLTQKKLAKISGIEHNTISTYEIGKRTPSIAAVEILADAIGISIDEYIDHKVQEKNH